MCGGCQVFNAHLRIGGPRALLGGGRARGGGSEASTSAIKSVGSVPPSLVTRAILLLLLLPRLPLLLIRVLAAPADTPSLRVTGNLSFSSDLTAQI